MQSKNFKNWTFEEVEDVFGLVKIKKMPLLEKWLNASHLPNPDKRLGLEEICADLDEYANAWNEDELKMCFIAPLIAAVHYSSPVYKIFTQRNLSATFPNLGWQVNGRVEWLISKGKLNPKNPFFCLHEYKQEKRRESDPLGQLLVAMATAQALNESEMPIYGCYVIGRYWFFVVVDKNTYSVSSSYDATKIEELYKIFAILKEVQVVIDAFVGNP